MRGTEPKMVLFDEDVNLWWRAVGRVCVSGTLEDVDPYRSSTKKQVEVVYVPYRVVRHTPRGVRLDDGTEGGRFVDRNARKRFACPTKHEALISLYARTSRRVRILEAQLADARALLAHVTEEVGR